MDYKLVFCKRKTIAIVVSRGEVIVKAPKNVGMDRVDSFVSQKAAWIQKKLCEYEKNSSRLKPVIDGTHALVCGELYEIRICEDVKRVKLEGGALKVPLKYADAGARERAVSNWYRRTAAEYLAHYLESVSQKIGLCYASFALTNVRSKWGSCDSNCNIRLNWRLFMLDDELTEYVIVHELSHTLHHDHSAAFWAEVKKHFPRVSAAKKRLKEYSLLTSLYR